MLGKFRNILSLAHGSRGGQNRRSRQAKTTGTERLGFEPLENRLLLSGDSLVISEFMATNHRTLMDQELDSPDWIEIYNPTASQVELEGWYLSDNPGNLRKWEFPAATVASGDYLIVFASDKGHRNLPDELHTTFQLDGDGEYLALVEPDGTVAYDITYSQQFGDVSYGLTQGVSAFTVPGGENLTYFVPEDGSLGSTWTDVDFNDSSWTAYTEAPQILITEAGTGTPDYFEIQNVSPGAIDTSDWVVVANNASAYSINDVHTVLWQFPDEMLPGELAYRPDAAGDNIFWRNNDDGWVMILDGQGNIVDFTVWGYSPDDIATFEISANGFENIHIGEAWSGSAVSSSGAFPAMQRIGTADHNNLADWTFDVEGTPNGPNENLTVPFMVDLATGIGYDAADTGLTDAIQADIEADLFDVNSSVYLRLPFEMSSPSTLDSMQLNIKYNDGFVAYLNGQEVARRNSPPSVQWDSTAPASRPIGESLQYEEIDLIDHLGALQEGLNVLAIQGLNVSAADPSFLVMPDLMASGTRFFLTPTPGEANNVGVEPYGPIVTQITENALPPTSGQGLPITATVEKAFNAINQVVLHYRVMYGAESTITMRDDGTAGDLTADDGVYTAVIPSSAYSDGEMVRWYVTTTDIAGHGWRAPWFFDALDSPEYFGTVVQDPSVDTNLPVLQWFVENPAAAGTWSGTRSSVFYLDEFYDNVRADLHGQSTAWFTNTSYDFYFNRG